MRKILRNTKLYFRLWGVNIKTLAGFRGDFIIMLISGCLTQILSIVFIFALFQKIPSIAGWTLNELIFMFSIIFIVDGFVSVFFDGIWNLSSVVNSGAFDRIILRPISPVLQIVTLGFGPSGIGNILVGIVTLTYCLSQIHTNLSWINLMLILYTVILGIALRVCINLSVVSTAFWTKNGNPIMMANQGLSEFSKYPLVIFNKGIQLILIIIPYSFISFVPASALFEHSAWSKMIYLSPLVMLYCLFLTNLILKKSILKYESVGN